MTKRRRWPKILLAILLCLGAAFYYCFIDRAWRHAEKDGWVLDFSYVRLACPTCMGCIEKLEYRGQAIKAIGDPDVPLGLLTPVVWVESRGERGRWRYHGDRRVAKPAGEPLSATMVSNGYYEVDLSASGDFPHRRPGTPESWCLLYRWDTPKGYWLAPENYQKILQTLIEAGPPFSHETRAGKPATSSSPS
jgi:hypothetical protein